MKPPTEHLATPGVSDRLVCELPPSEIVCKEILECLEPLRYDAEYRAQFYGEMGVVRTELYEGASINGWRVLYKDERDQPSGSYKSRGASNAVMQHPEATHYVADSTGNHGRSVGIAAANAGKQATIFGVDGMSSVKMEGIKATRAELCLAPSFSQATQNAENASNEPGFEHIPPFGSHDVVAGQCTLGDELVEDLIKYGLANEVVIIPVSVAGAGHISGIAIPIWEAKQAGRLGDNIYVVGVQPEGTDTMNRALHKLRNDEVAANLYPDEPLDKDCDALAIDETSLNADTMSIVNDADFVAGMHTVSKGAIARGMDFLEADLGGNVEPAAALGHAFVEERLKSFTDLRNITVVLTVSGGNKSPETAAVYRRVERKAAWDLFTQWSNRQLPEHTSVIAEESDGTDRAYVAQRVAGAACLNGATMRAYTPSPYSNH